MESIRARFEVATVRFAATTDWDIDQAVLLGCQDELMQEASFGLADRTPERSAAIRVGAVATGRADRRGSARSSSPRSSTGRSRC